MANVRRILRYADVFAKVADDSTESLMNTLWGDSSVQLAPGSESAPRPGAAVTMPGTQTFLGPPAPGQPKPDPLTVGGKPAYAINPQAGYPSRPKDKVPGWNESYKLIDALPPLTGSAAERAVQSAKALVAHTEITGICCWDWINKVYYYADCTVQRVYQNIQYEGHDCGSVKADQNLLDQISPGDWLYVNNKNQYDTHGNHSVVVVEKLGPTLIKAASCWKSGDPGRFHQIDFNKQPVVHISKPVDKK